MTFDPAHLALVVSAKPTDELRNFAEALTTLNHQAAIELHEHLTTCLQARVASNSEKPWTVPKENG